ncbi:MAG: LacI family transcriptional regulator [bacterium]|nr:LacI family transcriptional regulator [bacterium]
MVSIKDVAKQAGVAISTVSKVLNGYPNVSEKTKKKVNEAIEELNFVPNAVASALSSKQSARVALIINLNQQTQAIDEIDMQYISGAIRQARELSLDVQTVFFSMIQDKTLEEITRYLRSQNIGGVIIYGLSKDDKVLHRLIGSQNFKTVVIDYPMTNQNTSSIWIDQERAQYEVAKVTIEANPTEVRNVLYLAGKRNGYVTEERTKGIRRLAEEKGFKLTIHYGEFSELRARELTFRYGKASDAIVCASDLMAIGAMKALTEMNVYHPVCGFDGITLMGYVGKQMNTVRQDFSHISEEAVKEVALLLNGMEGRNVVLDYQIVRLKYLDIIC